MAAKPKLTPEQWAEIKDKWESDPRDGFAWLTKEMDLPISRAAVRKSALADNWVKKKYADPPVKSSNQDQKKKVSRKVTKVPRREETKVSVTMAGTIQEISGDDSGDGRGRPTKYREEYAEQAYRLCLIGYTDKELADFFDVDESTINNWKLAHEDFFESIRKGKAITDANVAEKLYYRAMGYSHEDTHVSNYKGHITLTPLTKHYPPDTAAAFIWLKNRQPKFWKDRVELKEDINLNIFPPKDELDAIYEKALREAAERSLKLVGRRERIGVVIDHHNDDATDV